MRLAPLIGALLGLVLAAIRWGLPLSLKGVLTVAGAAYDRGMHLTASPTRRRARLLPGPGTGAGDHEVARGRLRRSGPDLVIAAGHDVRHGDRGRAGRRRHRTAGRRAWLRERASRGQPDGLGARCRHSGPRRSRSGERRTAVPNLWQGPLAVAAAVLVTLVAAPHHKRFGGVTGDVLGFLVELDDNRPYRAVRCLTGASPSTRRRAAATPARHGSLQQNDFLAWRLRLRDRPYASEPACSSATTRKYTTAAVMTDRRP